MDVALVLLQVRSTSTTKITIINRTWLLESTIETGRGSVFSVLYFEFNLPSIGGSGMAGSLRAMALARRVHCFGLSPVYILIEEEEVGVAWGVHYN